jgi:uncharacterized membrane protein YukC
MVTFLTITLIVMIIAYVFYHYFFMQKRDAIPKEKPYFTLKIEHENS